MSSMRAAVLHGIGDLRVEEIPTPEPGPGEVLIRVAVCGVCGSDAAEFGRELVLAKPPVVLGHEFAGEIVAIGSGVESAMVGKRVVCGAGISCGNCPMCLKGRTNLCRTYSTLGFHHSGGLAGYVVSPARVVLDVSHSALGMDTLGLTQPMAIAVHAVRRSGLVAGQVAVVVGIGGIGAFLTKAVVETGASVLAVDLDEERLELARRLGASETHLSAAAPLHEFLGRLSIDPDAFFEVSGSAGGIASVFDAATPGSTIVPVGIQGGTYPASLGSWTLGELTIVGTVAHTFLEDFPEAIRILESRSDWSDIAREVVSLEAVEQRALRPLLEGNATQIKTLVDPWVTASRPAIHDKSVR